MWKRYAGVNNPIYHLPEDRYPRDENTCPVCGLFYVQDLRSDQIEHGKWHRRAMAVLDPKPHDRLAAIIELGQQPPMVTAMSPRWMHREMYLRAARLSREEPYRVLWDEDGRVDLDVAGHLLLDDTGEFGPTTIVGAAGFRKGVWTDPEPRWTLEWVWITPKLRSRGILSRAWPTFQRLYGDFPVERPLTEAMTKFLTKHSPRQLCV